MTPSDGKSSCCLWQGEPKKKKKMKELPLVAMFVNGSRQNDQSL
jgi:hypothetical protein